jgi:ABC-type transport system involved in multi-copper enzyme maturation permease subunit
VTALTDERVRGGLDVLLATPLATRAVVAAKWRAAFRRVPWVALPTGLIAAVQSWYSKEWPFAFYLVVLVLFGGAAVTSLGLLIATWVSRTGRAVALSVGVYVVVAVGLPMVGALMESSNGNGPKDFAFVIGSPLYGPVFLSLVHESFLAQQLLECREPFAVWSLVWVGVYLVLAVLLYLLTLASFNRCLGRVNEKTRRKAHPLQRVGFRNLEVVVEETPS